jgi:fatty acid-binding protein DegV
MLSSRLTIFTDLITLQTIAVAQTGKSTYVRRDPRVDKLVDKYIELNKQASKGRVNIEQGYRLLVVNTNQRELAMKIRGILLNEFPEHKTYMSYQTPNFRVHFGNFSTRKEAEKVRKELPADLGSTIIIVPTKIEKVVTFNEKSNPQ